MKGYMIIKIEDVKLLVRLAAKWAREVPPGLGPLAYGTGTEEGDKEIHDRVEAIIGSIPKECPGCGAENDDDWPITVGDMVKGGGCQTCWESECDAKWWEAVSFLTVHPPVVCSIKKTITLQEEETNADENK